MFYLDARRNYRVAAFDRFDWLDYGFGTRHSGHWLPSEPATVRQIHSNHCVVAERAGVLGHADALVTATPGTWLAIRTADCVPMLIADERRRVVAAVHAGWRGSAANIAGAAVRALAERFGSDVGDLHVAIGPAICGACYEVGPEVAREFRVWRPERPDLDGKTRVDLTEVNRRQFVAAGVRAERIATGAPCTLEDAGGLHSHRREPHNKGRNVTAIAIRD